MFIEIPASKSSLSRRKLVLGVGVNDANYTTQPVINGKPYKCPYYTRWVHMLKRCYSTKYQEKQPTYIGCTVCDDWLIFSKFKSWMIKQDWKGRELDKDLLVQGNKIYAPQFCLFVTSFINSLFGDCGSRSGLYPTGVYFDKVNNKFKAQLSIGGTNKNLGRYQSKEQARTVYLKAKYALIKEVASSQSEPLKTALLNYKLN